MGRSAEVAISLTVCGQDCSPEKITADELESIGMMFQQAADAVRKKLHGTISLYDSDDNELAAVDIDQGEGHYFDEENGIPILLKTYVDENPSRKKRGKSDGI